MSRCVYIFLPVHNRRDITSRFIECLKVQSYDNFHLVLIDDGSTDGTDEMVRRSVHNLTVLKGKGDWWWAGSLQQGYLWLKRQHVPGNDIILIINDDTQFRNDFLETAVRLLSEKSRTLLLACYFSFQDGRLIDSGVHVDWKTLSHQQAATPDQINCLSTRGLFFRMADFMEIGGFHPRLLPHYASDLEFTIRAHRKGFTLTTDPSLQLIGDEQTTGIQNISEESLMISIRKLFSIKFILNPVVWSSYIALACPWRWKVINIWRIWRDVFYLLAAAAIRDIKRRLFGGRIS
jgi:GT2 family glycosyltransferase